MLADALCCALDPDVDVDVDVDVDPDIDSLSLQVIRHPTPSLFFNLFLMIYFEGNMINNEADKDV